MPPTPMQWTRFRAPWNDDAGAWWQWLRDLEGLSGVYEIRDVDTGDTLWIGESHSDQLYSTITRHFQQWDSRSNRKYDRRFVEVRVMVTPPELAVPQQHLEIQAAEAAGEPLDNVQNGRSYYDTDDEEAPF